MKVHESFWAACPVVKWMMESGPKYEVDATKVVAIETEKITSERMVKVSGLPLPFTHLEFSDPLLLEEASRKVGEEVEKAFIGELRKFGKSCSRVDVP